MHRSSALIVASLALVLAACSGDDDAAPATTSAAETDGTEPDETDGTEPNDTSTDGTEPDDSSSDGASDGAGLDVVAGEPFPDERCAANEAAGTIDYFTGFDYAATASILEVIVAEESGYYDELCLDVEITPSFSVANYPLVAANEAQFSSAGSFSELATQARANDADLIALSVDGHIAVDVLMVKPDRAAALAELEGETIGVKGALPPAIAVMLQQEAGLAEGDDFRTALLDGFDPFAHWAIDDIAALPGWRSNEPGALERGGETFDLYDPAEYGVPGSFGLIYTNGQFLAEHPTAAEDFMRATMRGLADAIADPAAAAATAFGRAEASGNPAFLSIEGETFRWSTDAAAIVASTPADSPIGAPVAEELEAQIAAYDAVGYFGEDGPPAVEGRFDPELVAGLYDDSGVVIWPG